MKITLNNPATIGHRNNTNYLIYIQGIQLTSKGVELTMEEYEDIVEEEKRILAEYANRGIITITKEEVLEKVEPKVEEKPPEVPSFVYPIDAPVETSIESKNVEYNDSDTGGIPDEYTNY